MPEVDGLNTGYARALLDEYLENPEEFLRMARALRERDSDLLAQHPGVARLVELLRAAENGQTTPVVEGPPEVPAAPAPAPAPTFDEIPIGAVAAAMALVKAYRTHGHLAARLDPARSPSATPRSSPNG